jgi:hypothetical protein
LISPGIDVTNLIFPNDDMAWVYWRYSTDNVSAGKNVNRKNVNMAVVAYVTTQDRLKLDEYLRALGKSVRYCDTDSFIYIQKVDEAPKVETGDYLGDLADELEEFGSGSKIEEFVLGGPKNRGFTVFCSAKGKLTSKCKGYNRELQFTGGKLYFFEKNDSGRQHTAACTQS